MDPALRKRILAAYPQAAFDAPAQMSTTYYALDPAAFAVKVYRHWRGLADQQGFLKGLLSGAVVPGARQRDRW